MNPQTESKSILDNPQVMERCIIYARVSTDEQAESGTSIDNQVEKSLAYASAHNMNVVAIFKEDYTGKVLDRPELNKVREMLRAGLADNLIVYKANRLDRSEAGLNLLMLLLQELKPLGVSLHYSQSGRRVDLTNPVEVLMQSIEGWQAGEDHRETIKKLHEGIVQRAKSGYVVPTQRPFGYEKVKMDKKWYFQIVEAEAVMVRLIFQWYVLGDETGKTLTMTSIAKKLNTMGCLTRDGKKWIRASVYSVLIGEVYCGTWYYGKTSKLENAVVPIESPIPVEVPAIISRELWEAAQEQLEHNKVYASRNRRPGRYLLANRVTCGSCHYRMTGRTIKANGSAYVYYHCPTRDNPEAKSRRKCDLPSFKADVVDIRVWDKLEEAAGDENKLIDGLKGYQARQESKVEPIRRELGYVEQLIKDKNAEWEGAYLDQKLLTSERAKARKAIEIDELEQVIKELEKRRGELLTDLEEKTLTDEQIMGLNVFRKQVLKHIEIIREAEAKGLEVPELRQAVFEEKRKLLAILDVQVTLYVEDGRKKGDITAKFFPKGEVLSVELGTTSSSLHNRQNWIVWTDTVWLD